MTEAAWFPFATAGLGSCAAVCFSHPIDTLKVRLQLMGEMSSAAAAGKKMGIVDVIRVEGLRGLYKGLTASLARQITYTTTRFGVYGMIKDARGDNFGAGWKIGTALASGAVGAFVGCPCDVTLVRMQADGRLPPELRRKYKNIFDGVFRISREEGPLVLFRGGTPLIVRGMLMTAGQIASYDLVKEQFLERKWMAEGVPLHFTCSLIASFVAAAVTSPVDVVKTRIMSAGEGMYKGALDCCVKTLKAEGPLAFYKGFVPYYIRLGPHTILTFVFMEQFKNLLLPFATIKKKDDK